MHAALLLEHCRYIPRETTSQARSADGIHATLHRMSPQGVFGNWRKMRLYFPHRLLTIITCGIHVEYRLVNAKRDGRDGHVVLGLASTKNM